MIEQELEKLNAMSLPEIKNLFLRYFNYKATARSKEFYLYKIAYRMQELEFGGLASSTKNLLIKMEVTPKAASKKSVAPIGTRIIKNYKGKDYEIRVTENGFDLDGQHFKSLSGMAKKITGMKISGNVFFGLGQRGK